MKRKIIAFMVLGGLIYGCIWFYFGHSADNAILAKHNIHNVLRRVPTEIRKLPVTVKTKPVPTSRENERGILVEATAYTWTGHRTNSGQYPVEGQTIAINPAKFKLGQRIYIVGHGWRIAEDIIPPESVEKGADIDLYMGDDREAKEWGRKMVRVYVYR